MTFVIQISRQSFPQLQRVLVEPRIGIEQVIGADDGGVAPDIAAADPALFKHGDIGDAVLLGEVIGGGQPVPATADDDDIVRWLRLRTSPSLRPILVVMEQAVAGQAPDRIAGHANFGAGRSEMRRLR
jgi:hypothetical protein